MSGNNAMAIIAAMTNDLTAIVLAGGQGTRMGGKNKGLVIYDGKPLVRHVLDIIAPQVAQVVISANRDLERYEQFGYPVITDQHDDSRGPLAGIAAALDAVTTDYVLIVPCDMPHLPRDLVSQLAAAMIVQQTNAVLVHDGERWQYLVSLMRREVAATARAYLDQGGRAVRHWLATHTPGVARLAGQSAAFRNLNTPASGTDPAPIRRELGLR